MINIFLLEKSYSGQKAISNRRVMQVLEKSYSGQKANKQQTCHAGALNNF